MHLEKCVDSSNSTQTLEIGHNPMASGILQSYPSHCVHCSNYHSTNLHQEISICCHGVNDVCINNAIGSYKYGNGFTISQKTKFMHVVSKTFLNKGLRMWFFTLKLGDLTARH